MKKKIFAVGTMIVLLFIFICPILKKNSVKIQQEKYSEGTNQKAADYLISKANDTNITNYNNGNNKEMFTFNHEATEQTGALTDYRYIGNNPNNYIYFNCTDENDTSTCEVWRIIGVFTVEDETGKKESRIKIIRDQINSYQRWQDNNDNETNDWVNTTINNLF